MVDLKKFRDMDRQRGVGDMPPQASNPPGQSPTRPPLDAPAAPQTDHGLEDPEWLDSELEDESAFSRLSHKLDRNPKIHDPDALAAAIGRKKYGAAGMAAKSAAGRKR